jgi:hypothetical protein
MLFYSKFIFENSAPSSAPGAAGAKSPETQPQTVDLPKTGEALPANPTLTDKNLSTLGAKAETRVALAQAQNGVLAPASGPVAAPAAAPTSAPSPAVEAPSAAPAAPAATPGLSPEEAAAQMEFENFAKSETGEMAAGLFDKPEEFKDAYTGKNKLGATLLALLGFGAAKDKIGSFFDRNPTLGNFFRSVQNFAKDILGKVSGGLLSLKESKSGSDLKLLADVVTSGNGKAFEKDTEVADDYVLTKQLQGSFSVPIAMNIMVKNPGDAAAHPVHLDAGKTYTFPLEIGQKLPKGSVIFAKSYFVAPEKK